jgi:signal transduction histidine kinase
LKNSSFTDIKASPHGPFRLLKYFIFSGFFVICIAAALLAAFLYAGSVETLRQSSENYARLLAENLNYNVYNSFYAPLKSKGEELDLADWQQFGNLDALIKDSTYGLKIDMIKLIDPEGKIVYCTDYDLIGQYDPAQDLVKQALAGNDTTMIKRQQEKETMWGGKWSAISYYPLREGTAHWWMLGNIYGVIQITQGVTDQYVKVQRSVGIIIMVSVLLMAFLFLSLTFIVRRGENILMERAKEEEKLAKRLQQHEKLASIGQMVATIAHEIRNPLGIIKSSAQTLARKENPKPERIKKLAEVIVEETTRLSAILTDFLDFARPRTPALKSLDIMEVLVRVKENLGQELESRNIRWINESSNGSEAATVKGDADLLYQVFLNLAINAFEAIGSDGEVIARIIPGKERTRIEFQDNGKGISDEDLSNIFTPFFTTHEMGTGLGLSVVHNIIEAHEGEISVSSEAGTGTIFTVILPSASARKSNGNKDQGV